MPAANSKDKPAEITFNFKAKVSEENDTRVYPTTNSWYTKTDWWHGNGQFNWLRSPIAPTDTLNNNYSNSSNETIIFRWKIRRNYNSKC